MDYLTEEIYNQQPPQIQKFLLRTSILDRLSGPLCDDVLAADSSVEENQETQPPAQQTLDYLESSNLFLIPLDEERIWYRYHHLFANLLRQRLRREAPEDIERLQRRASDWCAANGSYEEAFQYALAARDFQAAAQIVERQGLQLLKIGALSTILNWFTKLPEEIISARPRLNVYYAWTLILTGQTVDVEPYLVAAEESEAVLALPEELHGEIAAIRAYAAARQEDVVGTLEEANKALVLLPKDDFSVRSVVSFVLGGVHLLQGDLPSGLEAMNVASRDGERSGNIHVAVSAFNAMAGILERQGKLAEAEDTYMRALTLGTGRSGRPLPITAGIYDGLARLYLARKDLQKARRFAETSVELGEKWVNADSQIHGLLTMAQIAQLEGSAAEAQKALAQAKQLAATHILTPGTQEFIENIEKRIRSHKSGESLAGILPEPLSERELEVLALMAAGHSNSEIAEKLIIALGTVKAHTSTIYRKLDVRSRTEAVIKAGELGLL
jgi:LuxR family maltose regulon positive regulatory protein